MFIRERLVHADPGCAYRPQRRCPTRGIGEPGRRLQLEQRSLQAQQQHRLAQRLPRGAAASRRSRRQPRRQLLLPRAQPQRLAQGLARCAGLLPSRACSRGWLLMLQVGYRLQRALSRPPCAAMALPAVPSPCQQHRTASCSPIGLARLGAQLRLSTPAAGRTIHDSEGRGPGQDRLEAGRLPEQHPEGAP